VKLVEGSQLLWCEPLIFRSEDGKLRFEPLDQIGRPIVAPHAIKHIGHVVALSVTCTHIRPLLVSDYRR
jgi:hypothetical protein